MKDLANERDAVVKKLESFNFEPVNAENLLPDGAGSWSRLKREIGESDVVVLILGESYGWTPRTGPHAGRGVSVTELEFEEARRLALPILPFIKQLDATDGTPDAGREAFRQRIEDWSDGHFRARFSLASDLAEKVGRALVEFLGSHYLAEAAANQPTTAVTIPSPSSPVAIPDALVEHVQAREAMALIGTGVSLAAGLPSAELFIEAMRVRIERDDAAYRPPASGSLFFAVATDLEALLGPDALVAVVRELVDRPLSAGTTSAHRAAVDLFDLIITTNYDELLERAVPAGTPATVVSNDGSFTDLSASPTIVKLHGSVNPPDSLVVTEAQLAGLTTSRPRSRAAVVDELGRRPLVAVGSSLRDPGLVSLLEAARPGIGGWVVAPTFTLAERQRLRRWNLSPLPADAQAFFAALRAAL